MSKVKKQELFLYQEQFRSKYHTVSHYEVFPWNVKKLVRGATNSFVVVIFYSFFTTPPFWRENLSKRDQDKPTYVSNTSSDMTELRGNRLKCNELSLLPTMYQPTAYCLMAALHTQWTIFKKNGQKFWNFAKQQFHWQNFPIKCIN